MLEKALVITGERNGANRPDPPTHAQHGGLHIMDNTVARNKRISASYTRLSNECHIEQRICLWCTWWMRSTGSAHRKCNHCKRDFGGSPMRVGNRIRPVEGVARGSSCGLAIDTIEEEYYNVLHLGIGA